MTSASYVVVTLRLHREDAMSIVVRALLIVAFTFLTLMVATNALAQVALQCWEFSTWEQAQATYESAPWMGVTLDPDGNGTACECLLNGIPC